MLTLAQLYCLPCSMQVCRQKLRYQGANLSYVSLCKLQALTYSYLPASVERTIQYKDWSVEGRLVFRSPFTDTQLRIRIKKKKILRKFQIHVLPMDNLLQQQNNPSHTGIHRIK
jgi:hypothetical protein